MLVYCKVKFNQNLNLRGDKMKSNNKKKILIVVLLLIFSCIGCGMGKNQSKVAENPKKNSPKENYPKIYKRIKESLESGYHEKFEIKKISYIKNTNVYIATCNPADDKEFVFEARTGGHKYGKSVWDRYGRIRVGRNIDQYYRPTIKKLFPYEKIVFYVNGGTYSNWDYIPSQKDLFEKDHKNTYVLPHIHIFENVIKKNEKKFLKSVLELKRILEEQDLKRSGIYIYIYRGKLFEDIDVNWLMNATDVFSTDIDLKEDSYDGHAKYSNPRIYDAERKYKLRIESKDYKNINSMEDIQYGKNIWKYDFEGYKKQIKDIKEHAIYYDYLITEEEINEWKKWKKTKSK